MQHLHRTVTDDELNGHLDEGAGVVWMERVAFAGVDQQWDVVLDHPEFADDKNAVLAFLQSVNPAGLDEAMSQSIRLSESPGNSALRALVNMVLGAQGGP